MAGTSRKLERSKASDTVTPARDAPAGPPSTEAEKPENVDSLVAVLLTHSKALDRLADAILLKEGMGPLATNGGALFNKLAEVQLLGKVDLAKELEGGHNLASSPPLNVIQEFRGLIPDTNAVPGTPLSTYIGGGGPAAVVSIIGPRIAGWRPFLIRGLRLDLSELQSAYLVGHLTFAIAKRAYAVGEPLVPNSW